MGSFARAEAERLCSDNTTQLPAQTVKQQELLRRELRCVQFSAATSSYGVC